MTAACTYCRMREAGPGGFCRVCRCAEEGCTRAAAGRPWCAAHSILEAAA